MRSLQKTGRLHRTVKFNQDTFIEINKDFFIYMFHGLALHLRNMPEQTKLHIINLNMPNHQLMLGIGAVTSEKYKVRPLAMKNRETYILDGRL